MTMTLWAVVCLVCFAITFLSTRERIKPITETRSSPKQDFADLLKNGPWYTLFAFTLFNFAMLTYRGGASYNLYHHWADRGAMFDFLAKLGLTTPNPTQGPGLLEWLGFIVHGTRDQLASSNVADVYNSIVNGAGFLTTIIVIILSAGLSKRFGKKSVICVGFLLAALNAFAYYFLTPASTVGLLVLAMMGSLVYAPTIAVAWAMYADAADYSEWQTGRRFTGIVFATIGFALKSGLALGSAAFLWVMAGAWGYQTHAPDAPNAITGYFLSNSIGVGILFVAGAVAIATCKLNKKLTLQMADELAERRRKAGLAPA
jgi:glycoside/pentoside/hexuronide:cation symporter, GPH family